MLRNNCVFDCNINITSEPTWIINKTILSSIKQFSKNTTMYLFPPQQNSPIVLYKLYINWVNSKTCSSMAKLPFFVSFPDRMQTIYLIYSKIAYWSMDKYGVRLDKTHIDYSQLEILWLSLSAHLSTARWSDEAEILKIPLWIRSSPSSATGPSPTFNKYTHNLAIQKLSWLWL